MSRDKTCECGHFFFDHRNLGNRLAECLMCDCSKWKSLPSEEIPEWVKGELCFVCGKNEGKSIAIVPEIGKAWVCDSCNVRGN